MASSDDIHPDVLANVIYAQVWSFISFSLLFFHPLNTRHSSWNVAEAYTWYSDIFKGSGLLMVETLEGTQKGPEKIIEVCRKCSTASD